MRVGLHSGQLSIRGSEVALWDYAQGLQARGHSVRVYAAAASPNNDPDVIRRFRDRFETVLYDRWDDVRDFPDLDFLYMIKAGMRDGVEPAPGVRYGVHAVFPYHEPHGDVYAYISRWLTQCMTRGASPYVSHIVELPDVDGDMRDELGIPAAATVLGRHGGFDSFDIPWAWAAVGEALAARDDLWFVFLNTAPGLSHERVIHLGATADPVEKVRFINTCDAMLHARRQGETFGLAPAEFSVRNKPVLTYGKSHEQAHIDILGEKAVLYRSKRELVRLLLAQAPKPEGDWNAYRDYCREAVMDDFERVFLGIEPKDPVARLPLPAKSRARGCNGPYWILRKAVPPRSGLMKVLSRVRSLLRG